MASPAFHHFGVPTSVEQDGEMYVEAAGVRVTDPEAHPFRIEFLRFDEDSCMHEMIRTRPHVSYLVDDLDAALSGYDVLVDPFDATEALRVAFIRDGDAVIELMQEIEG